MSFPPGENRKAPWRFSSLLVCESRSFSERLPCANSLRIGRLGPTAQSKAPAPASLANWYGPSSTIVEPFSLTVASTTRKGTSGAEGLCVALKGRNR